MTSQSKTDLSKDQLDSEEWMDEGESEIRPPVKSARSVVSVAFSAEDLERVSVEARRRGLKLSEFIRSSALERLDRSGSVVTSSSGVTVDYRFNRSRSASYRSIQETPEAVTAT